MKIAALALSVVAAVLLYIGSKPIPGAIEFIGENMTEQRIRAHEWRRVVQTYAGFGILFVAALLQFIDILRNRRYRRLAQVNDLLPNFQKVGGPGMARQVFHVSPAGDGKWRVEPEGGGQTAQIFKEKKEAVRHAKKAQAAEVGQIIVHRRDGRIEYETTYGADPWQRTG